MWEDLASWEDLRRSFAAQPIQSLVATCTASSPTTNDSILISNVCYDAHNDCCSQGNDIVNVSSAVTRTRRSPIATP